MKHPKKLNRKEKRFLADKGMDPKSYLRIKIDINYIYLFNVETQTEEAPLVHGGSL